MSVLRFQPFQFPQCLRGGALATVAYLGCSVHLGCSVDRPDFVTASGGSTASGGVQAGGARASGGRSTSGGQSNSAGYAGEEFAGMGGTQTSGGAVSGGRGDVEGGSVSGGSGGDPQSGGEPSTTGGASAGAGGDGPTEDCGDPNLTMCGGVCVDVATDLNHCRACGHSCGAGSTCDAGVCQAVRLHTSPSPLTALDANDKGIYFSPTGVLACPNTGCRLSPDSVSASPPPAPRFLANGYVLIAGPNPTPPNIGNVYSLCPTSGCTADNQIPLAATNRNVSASSFVAVDRSFYWTESNPGGHFMRHCLSPQGTQCTETSVLPGLVARIVSATDGAVFFESTLQGDTDQLYSCPGNLSECTPTLMNAPSYTEATAFGTDFYFLPPPSAAQIKLARCPITGCASTPAPVISVPFDASQLRVDASGVYWVQGKTSIQTCPLSGCVGGPTVLAQDVGEVQLLRVAGEFVYWVDAADNTVWRVAKPVRN